MNVERVKPVYSHGPRHFELSAGSSSEQALP